jgi:beta-galactosidase
VLRPDRARIAADNEDVSVVEAQVVDAQGRIVPTANHPIAFSVSAAGKILGVGNGDPSCHEADRATTRSAFNGLCMALVQATRQVGEIRIGASSPGLESATVVLASASATLRPALT